MYQVIIVEDDPMVAEIDKQYVEHNNKMTIAGVFQNGQDALEFARNNPVDLIMLDYYMPVMDGRTFLVKLRAEGILADVIMVTAASEARHVSELYSYGVSDYLIKPFALDELLARLRVLTRKKGSGSTNVYTLADLTVDTAARTAKRGDRTLELSAREYALLEYLIRSKGVVLSRQQIEDNLWSLDYAGGTNVVDVYISYLRKKLDGVHEKKLLHTVRGMGWVLKEDV